MSVQPPRRFGEWAPPIPRAPPLFQRSWCHCPTMSLVFVGFTATCGSTSALRQLIPGLLDAGTQPAYGLVAPDACTTPAADAVLANTTARPPATARAQTSLPF